MSLTTLVLSINTGSSSVRCALWRIGPHEEPLLRGHASSVGTEGVLTVTDGTGKVLLDEKRSFPDHRSALVELLEAFRMRQPLSEVVVGHRVVHGGPRHSTPVLIDAVLVQELRGLEPLAPLHQRPSIDGIEVCQERLPGRPQVACFDTAFHHGMPHVSRILPLPRDLYEAGILRYGFHGLSFEYLLAAVPAVRQGRSVLAHLGSGCSLAAVRDGQSVDTTMGLTPSGGLMMATRAGDLDPGVVLYLLRQRGLGADQLESLLDTRSGLLGLSGRTSDMRQLLDRGDSDSNAADAVAVFCHVARRHIGAMAASLGGIDQLAFTGGIGESAPPVRRQICDGLQHLGVEIEPGLNQENAPIVSRASSRCAVYVVATDEELVIARHAAFVSGPG